MYLSYYIYIWVSTLLFLCYTQSDANTQIGSIPHFDDDIKYEDEMINIYAESFVIMIRWTIDPCQWLYDNNVIFLNWYVGILHEAVYIMKILTLYQCLNQTLNHMHESLL